MAFIYRKPRKAISEATTPKSALHLPSIAEATGVGKGTAVGEWKGIFGGKPKHKVDIPPEHLENVQRHHEFMSNMTGLGLMASGFVGPAITGAGVIKGVGREVGGRIRKTMATEQRSRGVAMKSMENVKGLVDYVTRGIWLHGRRTYPQQGATFEGARMKTGNLGEPQGISLTADKELLRKSFAKPQEEHFVGLDKKDPISFSEYEGAYNTWKHASASGDSQLQDEMKAYMTEIVKVNGGTFIPFKHGGEALTPTQLKNIKNFEKSVGSGDVLPPFARTFPTFGGAPSERVLPAWVAPETQWAQDIIKDAYIESLPTQVKQKLGSNIGGKPKKGAVEKFERFRQEMLVKYGTDDKFKYGSDLPKFTRLQSDSFVLDSPADISLMIKEVMGDITSMSDPTEAFNKRISQNLLKKGYKALLYSPERYNEYEMRMLDPRDVLMLDMRTQESKGLERMYVGNKYDATQQLEKDAYNLLQQHTFGEIKNELDFMRKSENLSFLSGLRNKVRLYETALKIHKQGRDPRSVKEKGRSQQNRIEQWKSGASPREGSSLRDIYKTITWEDIERVLGTK